MRKVSTTLSILLFLTAWFLRETPPSDASPSPPSALEPREGIPQAAISITLRGEAEPTYQIISGSASREQQAQATPMTLHFPEELPFTNGSPLSDAGPIATTADFVDNWDLLIEEDFEGVFPQGPCAVYDASNDGFERTWDEDDFRPFEGSWAGWPANGGVDGVDPAVSDYPANLDGWLICGPFDLSDAQDFLHRFYLWWEIYDADDFFFVGSSTDGHTFGGLAWRGVSDWVHYHVWFQGVTGDDSVWIGWLFHSDGDADRAEGAWIDNLEVWRYNTPFPTCGSLDPGDKGVVVNPYEWVGEAEYPIIRAGDTMVVDGLVAADVHWVRMVFRHREGIVRQQEYDRMVDTLCANGISVLGVVNHETLVRQDFNDPASAVDYRHEFTGTVGFIVDRFEGRITYWEVWNEENYDSNPDPVETGPPYVMPSLYAPLLDATYQSIKEVNPAAQVLFGGLGSAWEDSLLYFQDVYAVLGISRPFDYFAIHPYYPPPERDLGLDPEVYMHSDPGYDTILDKFMEEMDQRGDGEKTVWVTEIGWNSAAEYEGDLHCLEDVVVTEQEQAEYLKSCFDILFNEVELWQQPGTQAVEKVIWYQYMDVGIPWDVACPGEGLVGDAPWSFGLYRSDKSTPKPSRCAFLAYPGECRSVFLPVTSRDHLGGGVK